MPVKHIVKSYEAPAFYHVYNRASGERKLFRESADRDYFVSLLQKYLTETELPEDDLRASVVQQYDVEIVAYCLMGTHFHLLIYQEIDPVAITGYMRAVGTAYSMYYNKKYKSKGHVFQSNYRASHITAESYLSHITRYIHLNPTRGYENWKWSSYPKYIGKSDDEWVHPERVVGEHETAETYRRFVADYATTDRRIQQADLGGWLAF